MADDERRDVTIGAPAADAGDLPEPEPEPEPDNDDGDE